MIQFYGITYDKESIEDKVFVYPDGTAVVDDHCGPTMHTDVEALHRLHKETKCYFVKLGSLDVVGGTQFHLSIDQQALDNPSKFVDGCELYAKHGVHTPATEDGNAVQGACLACKGEDAWDALWNAKHLPLPEQVGYIPPTWAIPDTEVTSVFEDKRLGILNGFEVAQLFPPDDPVGEQPILRTLLKGASECLRVAVTTRSGRATRAAGGAFGEGGEPSGASTGCSVDTDAPVGTTRSPD